MLPGYCRTSTEKRHTSLHEHCINDKNLLSVYTIFTLLSIPCLFYRHVNYRQSINHNVIPPRFHVLHFESQSAPSTAYSKTYAQYGLQKSWYNTQLFFRLIGLQRDVACFNSYMIQSKTSHPMPAVSYSECTLNRVYEKLSKAFDMHTALNRIMQRHFDSGDSNRSPKRL